MTKGRKYSQEYVEDLEKEVARLRRDWRDMYNARQTTFHRCQCGHLAEPGIICPNKDCTYEK